jgi:Ubiquinol-cytochrome C reductase complex 14kD subunit
MLSVMQHVAEAIRRTPQEVLDSRMQRHKRAMDLSLKHISLSKEMQDKQTPFDSYLQDTLERVEAEEAERFALGAGRSKDRQIP